MYIQFGASAKGVVMFFFFSLFITKFRCIKNTNWFCSHLWNLATKGRGNCIKMQKVCARFVCLSLTHSISLSLSQTYTQCCVLALIQMHTDAHTHVQTIHHFIELFVLSFCCPSSLSISLSFLFYLNLFFLFLHILRYYT